MYRLVHGGAIKRFRQTKMFYVYVLSNKEGVLYTGFAHDLKNRFKEHNNGKSFFTRSRGPWRLIFYEAYLNKYDALRREKYLKSSKGKTTINSMLREFLSKR